MLVYVCAHILILFLFTGLTVNKTEIFSEVYMLVYVCTHISILFLFTGLTPV